MERRTSPDGALTLVVEREGGETLIGFDGFQWHTHGDLLVGSYGTTEQSAVDRFIDDILNNHAVIVVCRVGDAVRDVWISDDPAKESLYAQAGETLELRYWNGGTWHAS